MEQVLWLLVAGWDGLQFLLVVLDKQLDHCLSLSLKFQLKIQLQFCVSKRFDCFPRNHFFVKIVAWNIFKVPLLE